MINPEKIKSVQAKIKAALDLIEKEENVKISFGNCSYTPAYYKTGMTVTSQEKSEKVDNLLPINVVASVHIICSIGPIKSVLISENIKCLISS
jgi:hypothetical protein